MTTDTLRFIEAAGKHDFSFIELNIDRTEASIKKHGLAKLQATLHDSGVKVLSLNAIDNYPIMTEGEMSASLSRASAVIQLCNDLESEIIMVNPVNFSPGQKRLAQDRFDIFIEKTAEISEKHNVKVGYEYVSYHDKVVNTLHDTVEGLGRWKEKISLVLDVFHMYRSGETFTSLPQSMTQLLLAFHVNDAPPLPIEKVVDTDRVFPLDGAIDLPLYIQQLREREFNGPVSVELFNKKYWELGEDKVVEMAMDSLERVLSL
jgi:sugar phosphate isomerase/epimerase